MLGKRTWSTPGHSHVTCDMADSLPKRLVSTAPNYWTRTRVGSTPISISGRKVAGLALCDVGAMIKLLARNGSAVVRPSPWGRIVVTREPHAQHRLPRPQLDGDVAAVPTHDDAAGNVQAEPRALPQPLCR